MPAAASGVYGGIMRPHARGERTHVMVVHSATPLRAASTVEAKLASTDQENGRIGRLAEQTQPPGAVAAFTG